MNVYVRTGAGKVHKAVREDDGLLLTAEVCNLDDAHERSILDDYPEGTEPSELCGHCFPPGPDTDEVPA